MTSKKILLFLATAFAASSAEARVRILVSLPDFIEVVRGVGGDLVEVDSLLDGTEDAHFVDAVPSFISKAAKADIVCAVGLELEIGWLPKVLAKSGNAKIQKGGKGFCEFGEGVDVLEKHTGPIDRSMGDVHAAGNPHFNLAPLKLAQSAKVILRHLKEADPSNASFYEANAKAFEEKMTLLSQKISTKLASLKGKPLIQFHKEFTYFFEEYGLSSTSAIEEKPGVPPSSARIAQVSKDASSQGVILAIAARHSSSKHLQKFSEISGIPHVKVPSVVQKSDPALNSIEKVQTRIADEILKGAKAVDR
jgi:zinc/manganese transport system substrate-binding protein